MSEPKPQQLWLPPNAANIAAGDINVALGIMGPAGAGKSFLIRQLALRWLKRWPQRRILVLASENPSATIGSGLSNVFSVMAPSLGQVTAEVDRMVEARKAGFKVPDIVFWDSASGSCDREREKLRGGREGEDTRSGYFDLGAGVMGIMIKARDELKTDWVTLCTTTQDGRELCIDGKMAPRSFTRLTTVCFMLMPETIRYDTAAQTASEQPHRSIGVNEKGQPVGMLVDRVFTTMNTGEFAGKGHFSLGIREKAILADVLAKIHGEKEEGS